MKAFAPLPASTRSLVAHNTHPGLLLDKYAPTWTAEGTPGKLSEEVQRPTLEGVVALTSHPAMSEAEFQGLRERHRVVAVSAAESRDFTCKSTGPLTLHLARASALENAGICLHPVYGFVYLPGSGLKGMSRAYATTVWLPQQPDPKAAWRQIEDVFGWAPTPERRELFKDGTHPAERRREDILDPNSPEIRERAGQIVFHDAWPTTWPKLEVDILNNHHQKYYSAKDGDNDHPPGDWENPVPVYFLSVPAGAVFEFALGKRRDDVEDELLERSREWLLGALCHLGAGAKTASGYGSFRPVDEAVRAPQLSGTTRLEFATTLELVTPAFLAGANQRAEDCDLRPATLRGLLRWWWRTLHAGFVDVATLRRMEAAIWGDTNQGGAVRIEVAKSHDVRPVIYDKRTWAGMRDAEKSGPYGITGSPPNKTTQGLWYASYGMDESSQRDGRRQRYFLPPGAKWSVRLIARRSSLGLSAQEVLDQATTALWLLCEYGGVGSKAGKGFGSLSAEGTAAWDVDRCRRIAADCRQQIGLASRFRERCAASPSLEQALTLEPLLIPFDWPDVWKVLDQLGFACQAFAKTYAHRREKLALGMPRRIGRQGHDQEGRFEPTGPMRAMKNEARQSRREDNVRHTSPVRFHLAKTSNGFDVRVLALPAAFLPDLETSHRFLEEFMSFVAEDLKRRAALPMPVESARPADRTGSGRDRTPDQGRQGPPRSSSVTVAVITAEQVKQRLAGLAEGQAIVKVQSASTTGTYVCQLIKAAPKTNTGFQPDGSIRMTLERAPGSLPDGTFVVVRREGNVGIFVDVLGRFPSPPTSPPRPGGGPQRR
jgi:CRISPR-associated protein Cmr6